MKLQIAFFLNFYPTQSLFIVPKEFTITWLLICSIDSLFHPNHLHWRIKSGLSSSSNKISICFVWPEILRTLRDATLSLPSKFFVLGMFTRYFFWSDHYTRSHHLYNPAVCYGLLQHLLPRPLFCSTASRESPPAKLGVLFRIRFAIG